MLTTLTPVVYQGALSPEAMTVDVETGASTLDLTTVTGVSFLVRTPDGEEQTWAGSILDSTASKLTAQHLFVAGDTDQLGTFRAIVVMQVPGGEVRSIPKAFEVIDQFGVKKSIAAC